MKKIEKIEKTLLPILKPNKKIDKKWNPLISTKPKTNNPNEIQTIQANVDETRETMLENMELVILRGKKLETLKNDSQAMADEALLFNKNAVKISWMESSIFFCLKVAIPSAAAGLLLGIFCHWHWPYMLLSAAIGATTGYAGAFVGWHLKKSVDKFESTPVIAAATYTAEHYSFVNIVRNAFAPLYNLTNSIPPVVVAESKDALSLNMQSKLR